ncbi:MAG: hypothetical protein ACR2N2_00520 [Acidimicrobiia bacterium]
MKRLAVVVVALAMLAVACSSALPLDEYTELLTAATDAYVVESQNLTYDYQSGVEDGAREIVDSGADDAAEQVLDLARQETVAYLALLGDAMFRYHEALEALSPPDAVAEEHELFTDSVGAVLDALPAAKQDVENAESFSEMQQALAASNFADGQLRWTGTCSSLEQAITGAGQAVNLRCVKPTDPGPTP